MMLYGNTVVAPLRALGLGGLQVGAVRIHARGEAGELGLHDVLVEGAGEVGSGLGLGLGLES